MSNFSFTSFLNNNGGNNEYNRGNNARVNRPSERQIKFYTDLCERKKITRKDISQFTFDQLGKEIEQLQAMPDPASERQLAKIAELQKEIIELGGDLKPISQTVLDKLEGGRDGSASRMIQSLFDMRTQLNEVAPATDAQIKIMVEWFLCPDIPFEDFGIEKKVYLDHLRVYSTDVDTPEKLEKRAWRMVTPTEFAEQIRKNVTKKQASRFIDDNRAKFYEWRKTRITQQQAKYIRELEQRLANIYTPKEVEWAIVDGEVQQITKPNSRAEYNPTAYEPMEEMQLAQMSYEQASEWIDRLKMEVGRKNAYKSMHDEESVNGDAQLQLHEKEKIRGENRKAKDDKDAKLDEFNKLNDLIYSLEAILGYSSEEAHDAVQELIMEDVHSSVVAEHKARLKEFFLSTVTANKDRDEERWNSEMARIYNMCEEIPTALEILCS